MLGCIITVRSCIRVNEERARDGMWVVCGGGCDGVSSVVSALKKLI